MLRAVHNAQIRLDDAFAAVLVAHGRAHVDPVQSCVHRLDHIGIAGVENVPPQLARAGHLGLVGVKLLVQQHETPHPAGRRQVHIHIFHRLPDQFANLGFLGKISECGEGDALFFCPVARIVKIDNDQSGYVFLGRPSHSHHVQNVRVEFEPPFNELGGVALAIGQGDHILHPVQIDQVAVLVDVAGVACAEPARAILFDDGFVGCVGVLVVTLKYGWPADLDLPVFSRTHRDARRRPSDAGGLDLAIVMNCTTAGYFS